MAKKKSKRPNLPQETLERARAEMRGTLTEVGQVAPASNGGTAVAAVSTSKKVVKRPGVPLATRHIPTTEQLIAEYAYVLKDLRYLAILAAILMATIIVCAVALPRPTG